MQEAYLILFGAVIGTGLGLIPTWMRFQWERKQRKKERLAEAYADFFQATQRHVATVQAYVHNRSGAGEMNPAEGDMWDAAKDQAHAEWRVTLLEENATYRQLVESITKSVPTPKGEEWPEFVRQAGESGRWPLAQERIDSLHKLLLDSCHLW